jgi:hypothetical protein
MWVDYGTATSLRRGRMNRRGPRTVAQARIDNTAPTTSFVVPKEKKAMKVHGCTHRSERERKGGPGRE